MKSSLVHFFNDATGLTDYDGVWVGRLRQGVVVQATTFDERGDKVLADMYGHLVGFDRNGQKELLLEVKWEDGTTTPIHPGNVKLLGVDI